mmetsp:Transcript_18983/g.48019  ORF Transcript_18983/g.48019 Transcript_18983/m.48019 type:complete len:94 (+) Transcript_18983:182-463(+)
MGLDDALAAHKVVVVSKSWCPFCKRALAILRDYNIEDMIVLDAEADPSVQARAAELSGVRTVPNVFINGKSIGGCDNTTALHNSGKLKDLLEA